jgi:hypothetical protein
MMRWKLTGGAFWVVSLEVESSIDVLFVDDSMQVENMFTVLSSWRW